MSEPPEEFKSSPSRRVSVSSGSDSNELQGDLPKTEHQIEQEQLRAEFISKIGSALACWRQCEDSGYTTSQTVQVLETAVKDAKDAILELKSHLEKLDSSTRGITKWITRIDDTLAECRKFVKMVAVRGDTGDGKSSLIK